jgi:hypothetical protein
MPKFNVGVRIRATCYVEVSAKDETEAMVSAVDMVNDDTAKLVENADFIDVDVADCEELGKAT